MVSAKLLEHMHLIGEIFTIGLGPFRQTRDDILCEFTLVLPFVAIVRQFDHVEALLNGIRVEISQLSFANVFGQHIDHFMLVWVVSAIGLQVNGCQL